MKMTDEIAALAERLAGMTAIDADFALIAAQDDLESDGKDKAAMILDGMRTGLQQAREANAGSRVLTIWFDDNAARTTLSWCPDEGPGDLLRSMAENALQSALRANGDTGGSADT